MSFDSLEKSSQPNIRRQSNQISKSMRLLHNYLAEKYVAALNSIITQILQQQKSISLMHEYKNRLVLIYSLESHKVAVTVIECIANLKNR